MLPHQELFKWESSLVFKKADRINLHSFGAIL